MLACPLLLPLLPWLGLHCDAPLSPLLAALRPIPSRVVVTLAGRSQTPNGMVQFPSFLGHIILCCHKLPSVPLSFEFESLTAPNCATWVLVATAELPNPLIVDTRYSDYCTATLVHGP